MYFWLELISLQFLKAVLGVGEFRRDDSISGYWSAAGMAVGLTPFARAQWLPIIWSVSTLGVESFIGAF
jgi:hypothetical protein